MTEETTAAERRPTGKIVAAVFAAIVFAYTFVSVSNGEAEPSTGLPREEAWHLCKQAVTEELRNPDSADFELLSTDFGEQADGGWSIAGSLKAVNDFGAEGEVGYSCRVSVDGEVSADVS